PKLGVVVKLRDVVDLVLGFDRTMLGDTEIHPDAGLIQGIPRDSGVCKRFVRTVDGDATCASTIANLLARLVFALVVVTHACVHFANIAKIYIFNVRNPLQEITTKLGKRVAVWRGQPNSS